MSTKAAAGAALPRGARLQRREQYEAALAAGAAGARRHFILFARPNGQSQARIGIIASKKAVPRAVDRNRVKRLVRETFRVNRHRLGSVDIVVQVRRPLRGAAAAVRTELERLLAELISPSAARGNEAGI